MKRYQNTALKLFVVVVLLAGLSACATVSTDNPDAALIDARNALMASDVIYEPRGKPSSTPTPWAMCRIWI